MSNKYDALKENDDEDYGLHGKEINEDVVVPPGENKLQCPYWLWYCKRRPIKASGPSQYVENLKLIGKMATVEQFWSVYSHILRPSEVPCAMDYHLFKIGIKPMWEHEANVNGGKWIVRVKKSHTSRCWENLVLAMLGEQFMVGQEICGAVVSMRYADDVISLWNRTAADSNTTTRIRDTLRRVLNLPANAAIEYKTHKNNSSFRNDVFNN